MPPENRVCAIYFNDDKSRREKLRFIRTNMKMGKLALTSRDGEIGQEFIFNFIGHKWVVFSSGQCGRFLFVISISLSLNGTQVGSSG